MDWQGERQQLPGIFQGGWVLKTKDGLVMSSDGLRQSQLWVSKGRLQAPGFSLWAQTYSQAPDQVNVQRPFGKFEPRKALGVGGLWET